ncbi:MAG: DUF4834 family protein [Clostridiales bacterium]|nr:DUF4834 family protein [Clostridiales bacterium]
MKIISDKMICFVLSACFAFGSVYAYGSDYNTEEYEAETAETADAAEGLGAVEAAEAYIRQAEEILSSQAAAEASPAQFNSAEISEIFDINSGMYIETIDKGMEFISSVPNGAVVGDGVYFELPSNITAELLKDGESTSFSNKTAISAKGYYILKLYGTNGSGEKTVSVFTFRVGEPPSNKVSDSTYKYPKVSAAASVAYDSSTGLYKYTLPNYKAFFSSVSGYGETVESASFVIPRNLGYSLTRNGQTLAFMNNKVYTESGSYSLKVYGYSYASGEGYEACYETTLNFTVYSEDEEDLSAINAGGGASGITSAAESVYSAVSGSGTAAVGAASETNIANDTLRESYFETAGIYSQAFSTGDAFYTNIPNDGIVGGNVYFDMPYNMSVSLTKDGTVVEFKNKSYINDDGSYTMIVTDVFDGITSRARFSFRIQSGVESAFDVSSGISDSVGETDSGDEEGEERFSVSNSYDSDRGMFVFDCGGESIYMSVPDGMVTNYDVRIEVPDSVDVVCEKDGEEINYSSSFAEGGRYNLIFYRSGDELSLSFDIAEGYVNYLDEFTVPEGYSLLVAEYSDNGGVYDTESEEYLEGISEINDQAERYESPFVLPLDGEYDFILQGTKGMPILSLSLFIDRTAPEIIFEGLDENMKTQSESVVIYCEETDAQVVLTDSEGNETVLDMSKGGGEISGSGSFTLIARDEAGNENIYEFVLGSKGGPGAFGAIIALIVLLALLGAFVFAVFMVIRKLFGVGSHKEKKEKKPKEKKEKQPGEKKAKKKKEKKPEEKEKKEENPEEPGEKQNIFEQPEKTKKSVFKLPNLSGILKKDKRPEEYESEEAAGEEYDGDDDWENDGWEDDGYSGYDVYGDYDDFDDGDEDW